MSNSLYSALWTLWHQIIWHLINSTISYIPKWTFILYGKRQMTSALYDTMRLNLRSDFCRGWSITFHLGVDRKTDDALFIGFVNHVELSSVQFWCSNSSCHIQRPFKGLFLPLDTTLSNRFIISLMSIDCVVASLTFIDRIINCIYVGSLHFLPDQRVIVNWRVKLGKIYIHSLWLITATVKLV